MQALRTPVRRPRDENKKVFPRPLPGDHCRGGRGWGESGGLFMDDFALIFRLGYDLQLLKENLRCDSHCPYSVSEAFAVCSAISHCAGSLCNNSHIGVQITTGSFEACSENLLHERIPAQSLCRNGMHEPVYTFVCFCV